MLYNPQWQTQNLTGWRKALWDAADHLDAHGWCRDRLRLGEARCVSGVLSYLACNTLDEQRIHAVITAQQKIMEAITPLSIPGWNDTRNTRAEVTGFLRKLATE